MSSDGLDTPDRWRICADDLDGAKDSDEGKLRWVTERGGWESDLQALVGEWHEDSSAPAPDAVDVEAAESVPPSSPCVPPEPATLTLRERLRQAVPAAGMASRMNWSRLVAVVSGEALDEATAADDSPDSGTASSSSARQRRRQPTCVEVNSGGQVFFGLLAPEAGRSAEEGVVFKFCNARHRRQSEQMAAELAWHLEVPAPVSRLLLRVHDEEWHELKGYAAPLCEELGDLLTTKQSMLVMQFVPGRDLSEETAAWETSELGTSAHALGRLLVLDMLLGNADRLPISSLAWRGNPSNVLWSRSLAGGESSTGIACSRCAPIDALVARRPPRMKVHAEDQKVGRLLELILLDAESAHGVMLEAVSCNPVATAALEADWEARKQARAQQASSAKGAKCEPVPAYVNAVKSFHDGVRAALALACREQGLLETIATVMQSWFDIFHEDMHKVSHKQNWRSNTIRLKQLSQEADKDDGPVKERWSSWQAVMEEKSAGLLKAVEAWATERGVPKLSFKGFLGETLINPVVDVYELLVRIQQLIARVKVMAYASSVTRPCDLSPSPLFVGPATASTCFHMMRKLGITCILNCTTDLLEPEPSDFGEDISWHRLALVDVEDQDMSGAFKEALRIIDGVVAVGGRVLVHCHEGKSRSVAVCLAYMMARQRKTLADGMAFIKSRRPQVRPNRGFWEQLVAFELAELGTTSVSSSDAPKGKPRGLVCDVCGETVGLTEEALATHKKQKHKESEGE